MDDADAALPRFTGQDPSGASAYGEASALVALHSSAHPGGESFPVLKAFQDYLEAERDRNRQRTTMLAAIFAAIIVIVLVSFGLIWHSSVKSSREREAMLWQVAMAARTQPPAQPRAVAPAQPGEDTAAVVAAAVTKAQADQAALFADKLEAMNKLVAKIQDDNAKLQKALEVRASAPAPAKPAVAPRPAAGVAKARPPATAKAVRPAAPRPVLSIPTVPPPPAPVGYAAGSYGIRLPKEPNPLPWHIYMPMK